MQTNLVRFATVLIFSVTTLPAFSDTVSFTSAKDNSIFSDQTANSNGVGGSFHTGRSGGTGVRHGLIAFNIAGNVPPLATINNVQLSLTLTESPTQTSPDTVTVSLHRLLADWGEGASFTTEAMGTGMGTAASTDDATWINRFHDADPNPPDTATPWTTAGGDVDPASASQSINKLSGSPALNVYTWQSAAMIAEVQSWLNTPATNFGWMLIGDESVIRTTRRFASKESTESLRPVLTIDFTPIPEPATFMLAVIGAAYVSRLLRQRCGRPSPRHGESQTPAPLPCGRGVERLFIQR